VTASIWMGFAIIEKPKKNNTICFLSNFWEVNKRLVRKPFPIPKISTVLHDLVGNSDFLFGFLGPPLEAEF
jgi:hypothetical protein